MPVFTSSLMLVPMVHRMLPRGRAVGIMTVDASSLGAPHLAGAGITPDMPVVVAGLETEKEFARVMLDDALELDVDAARGEHVAVARRLVAEHPEIGAIVLECTNMPPYAADVQAATGLPVFDITGLIRMVHCRPSPRSPAASGIAQPASAAVRKRSGLGLEVGEKGGVGGGELVAL